MEQTRKPNKNKFLIEKYADKDFRVLKKGSILTCLIRRGIWDSDKKRMHYNLEYPYIFEIKQIEGITRFSDGIYMDLYSCNHNELTTSRYVSRNKKGCISFSAILDEKFRKYKVYEID